MRRLSGALLAACVVAPSLVACMDLFHGTDFETLCTRDPANAACGGDAAIDAAQVEAPDLCAIAGDRKKLAQRACAWLGACEGPKDSSRFGPCYVEGLLAFDCQANPSLRPRGAVAELWACLAKATSCGDVDKCLFGGAPPSCQTIAAGSFTACAQDGKVRVQCAAPGGERPSTVEPCGLFGRTCTTLDSSRAACTAGRRNKCTGGDQCAGTSASACKQIGQDALDLGIDCAGWGAGECVYTAQLPTCMPGPFAGSCDVAAAGGKVTCSGAVAHVCVKGRDVAMDCAALGLGCVDAGATPSAIPQAACAPTGGASAPCTDDDFCVGSRLHSCGSGKMHEIDCTDVGLGACAQNSARAAFCSRR